MNLVTLQFGIFQTFSLVLMSFITKKKKKGNQIFCREKIPIFHLLKEEANSSLLKLKWRKVQAEAK